MIRNPWYDPLTARLHAFPHAVSACAKFIAAFTSFLALLSTLLGR
jgi:hypothetical protein